MGRINEQGRPPAPWAEGMAGLRAGATSALARNAPASPTPQPVRQAAVVQALQNKLGETVRSVVAPLTAPRGTGEQSYDLSLPARFDTPHQQQQVELAAKHTLDRLEEAWTRYAGRHVAVNRQALNDALADARTASRRDESRWSEATKIRSAYLQNDAAQLLAALPHDGQTRDRLNPETVGAVTNIDPDTSEETVTQVQLMEQQVFRNDRWSTAGFVAKGPQVMRNGERLLELEKTYHPRDLKGKLIIEREQAKAWVKQQILDRGISTLTDDQQRTKAFYEKRGILARAPELERLAAALPKHAMLGMADIIPRPRNNPNLPNIWRGEHHTFYSVKRWAYWHTQETQTSKYVSRVGLNVVPNVVTECGTWEFGKPPNACTVTPQPAALFAPNTGSLPGYKVWTSVTAWYTESVHPHGKYYGDHSSEGRTWQDYYVKEPESTPGIRVTRIGGYQATQTDKFYQLFFNAPFALTPWLGASLNFRVVPRRDEKNLFLTQVLDVTNGKQSSGQLGTLYSWTQWGNAKVGVKLSTSPSVKGHFGIQFEVGVFIVSTSNTIVPDKIEPTNPFIVNGKVELDQRQWEKQFARIRNALGFDFRSESVLPDLWGDKVACVFWRVPDLDLNFGNPKKWALRQVNAIPPNAKTGDYLLRDGQPRQVTLPGSNKFPSVGREELGGFDQMRKDLGMEVQQRRYVSVRNLAAMLVEAGNTGPEYRELQYVTPEALMAANKDQVKMIVNPSTGLDEWSLEVDSYVNTSLLVTTDRPGLFVQERNLPADLINRKTNRLNYALPHWLNHLTPDRIPAHVRTPKTLQDEAGRKTGVLPE